MNKCEKTVNWNEPTGPAAPEKPTLAEREEAPVEPLAPPSVPQELYERIEEGEASEWAKRKDAAFEKFLLRRNELMADAASRGAPLPTGELAKSLIDLEWATKAALTDEDGRVYEAQRELLYRIEELVQRIAVEYARMEFLLYRQQAMDAIASEVALVEQKFRLDDAEVRAMRAAIDYRYSVLLRAQADLQADIIQCRIQQEELRKVGLDKEVELIQKRMETLQERLKVLAPLWELVEQEELVVAAEQQRAKALELLAQEEEKLAEAREEAIPVHEEEAKSRKDWANAVMDSVDDRIAIAELGYRRAELASVRGEISKERAAGTASVAMARRAFEEAQSALEVARANLRLAVAKAREETNKQVAVFRKSAIMDNVLASVEPMKIRSLGDASRDKRYAEANLAATVDSVNRRVDAVTEEAREDANAIMARAVQYVTRYLERVFDHVIISV